MTGSTCKENKGNKRQILGGKIRKQVQKQENKAKTCAPPAPPVWHYGKVTSHSYYQAFKYCALQHYSPFFSPAVSVAKKQTMDNGRQRSGKLSCTSSTHRAPDNFLCSPAIFTSIYSTIFESVLTSCLHLNYCKDLILDAFNSEQAPSTNIV